MRTLPRDSSAGARRPARQRRLWMDQQRAVRLRLEEKRKQLPCARMSAHSSVPERVRHCASRSSLPLPLPPPQPQPRGVRTAQIAATAAPSGSWKARRASGGLRLSVWPSLAPARRIAPFEGGGRRSRCQYRPQSIRSRRRRWRCRSRARWSARPRLPAPSRAVWQRYRRRQKQQPEATAALGSPISCARVRRRRHFHAKCPAESAEQGTEWPPQPHQRPQQEQVRARA